MPELPEVETIKDDLCEKIIGKKIISVFPLWQEIVKDIPFSDFKKQVEGKKILSVRRRAKNIIIPLSGGLNLLLHLKMTGHILITSDKDKVDNNGRWTKTDNKYLIDDKMNQFIRIIFYLSGGKMMAMSDLRKFAYIKLVDNNTLESFLDQYGPEPFDRKFNGKVLFEIFQKRKTAVKKVLLDQKAIAGIGNIYADEILWLSRIHPLTPANKITEKEVNEIYNNIKKVFNEALKRRGTSTSDFRDTEGRKGTFGDVKNVYQMTDLPCSRCKHPISRVALNNRGTHFCPKCQKVKK